ncbi:hypothetical protein BH23CHL2_BH23CHL2_17740 [soil metagenome]
MASNRVRVWVEEIDPPTKLLFTWTIPDKDEATVASTSQQVYEALRASAGVNHAEWQDEGVLVEIDPEQASRYDLARLIRLTIDPMAADDGEGLSRIRVWAEDLSATDLRITWFDREAEEEIQPSLERRRVAGWLAVQPGVRSARLDPEGVLVRYDPERLDRGRIAEHVRSAVNDTTPLRERADLLLKRAPTYGNLARKLALDDRISPIPGAAKQAAGARAAGGMGGNVAMRTAMRFVPGAALITRIHTLVPMLMELSQWSREADPEIVDQHLGSVGLDRETLKADTITAHEIRLYARDSASETTAELGEMASAKARQAISKGREFLGTMRESMQSDREADGRTGEIPAGEDEKTSGGPKADTN